LDEALQEWVMDDSKAATSNYGYKCARLALKAAEKEIAAEGSVAGAIAVLIRLRRSLSPDKEGRG